jgi:cytosine deaminase
MREHGVGLGLGTDGIRDLWSPYGDGDMLRIALNFAQIQGLRHDEEIASALRLITADSARFVGRDQHDLAPGSRGDVVLVDAENLPDALLRAPRRELVVAGGRVVAEAGELVGR